MLTITEQERILEDLIHGRAVPRRDTAVRYKLTPREREEFARAKTAHYVIARRTNLDNAFYRWCDIHQQPFIAVCPRRRYAGVRMDLLCLEPNHLSPDAEKSLHAVVVAFTAVGGWFGIGGIYTFTSKVPIERAEELAQRMYAIWENDREGK